MSLPFCSSRQSTDQRDSRAASARRSRRPAPLAVLSAVALAAAALFGAPLQAAAHVGITPRAVRTATSETFTVRVPTERDVPTVALRLEFPATLTVARFQPKPGWQRQVERDAGGRITAAVWSGGRIEGGEFEDFVFTARTPDAPERLLFKAYQTYQDGETVEWVNAGDPRPGPAVDVTAGSGASPDDHGGAPAAGSAPPAATAAPPAATAPASVTAAGTPDAAVQSGSDLALFVSLGAGALSLLAVALSGAALARQRGDGA